MPKGSTDEVPISENPQQVSQYGQLVRQCLKAACEVVLAAEEEVNALDAKVRASTLRGIRYDIR